jgi:hypothetical protein
MLMLVGETEEGGARGSAVQEGAAIAAVAQVGGEEEVMVPKMEWAVFVVCCA